jgi:GNAT superfamily N-acetyltransferase
MTSVRPATTADATAMSALFAQFEHPTPAEPIPARLSRLREHDGEAFVAFDDTGLLGVATTQIVWFLIEDAPRAVLTSLVVREDTRGRGIGRALVDAVETWGRERGAGWIMVTTALYRAGAHAFYERMGFEFTGRRYVKSIR